MSTITHHNFSYTLKVCFVQFSNGCTRVILPVSLDLHQTHCPYLFTPSVELDVDEQSSFSHHPREGLRDHKMSFIAPALPHRAPQLRPVRIICGRKPRRRPKNPVPLPARPLPVLPPLPETPTIAPPPTTSAPETPANALKKVLHSRRDATVITKNPEMPIITSLFTRDNEEHTLVLVPTRQSALRVADLLQEPSNLPHSSRKTRVIVAAGRGPGTWKHAAMNANSSAHSVIVVATPRAMMNEFYNSHGFPWLSRVRFLIVATVSEMLANGCGGDLRKIISRVRTARKTVLIEHDFSEDVKSLTQGWLREKHGTVYWASVPKREVLGTRVMTADPRGGLSWLVNVVDMREGNERVLILFPAARAAEVYATMLRVLGREVIDVHAKTSAGNRLRGMELFKDGGVLLGTDTVLEDVDEVDLIISFGAVEEGVYQKRVQAGKRSVVMVRPEFKEMVYFAGVSEAWDGGDDIDFGKVRDEVGYKARRVAYQALIIVYASWRRRLGWSRPETVEFVNDWAKELFGEVPEIGKKFAGRRRLIGRKDVRVRRGPLPTSQW